MNDSRRKLIIYSSLILLFIGLTLVSIFLIQGFYMQRDVSTAMIREAAGMVSKQFREVVAPVERDLQLTRKWGLSGLLDLNDPQALDAKLLPLMESQPILSGLILADTTGRQYFLLRQGQAWVTRSAGPYRENEPEKYQSLDDGGQATRTWQEPRGYDPRTRNWFTGALETLSSESIHWTRPYEFSTTKKVGLTASVGWKTGENSYVAAFDIRLDDLYRFVSSLRITPNARVLLMGNDGKVMVEADSSDPALKIGFVSPRDLTDPAASQALLAWEKQGRGQMEALTYKSQGQTWWAGFMPLKQEISSAFIAVVIPESDLIGNLKKEWLKLAAIILLILLIGAAMFALVFRRYGRHGPPALNLNNEMEFADALKILIEAGESDRVEFKSTIRTNLKTGQTDKAMEIAWLKTVVAFLNSQGGALLIGVDDGGKIVGVEPDGFENHDKIGQHIKNLINQHIGPEFSINLKCDVQAVREKTVVMVTCEGAKTPAFLTMGKNEDFYVRSGPSSVKLSMSQVIKYLEHKKSM